MAPLVSMRPGPTAARNASQWATGRGKHVLRPSIRAIATSRSIATNVTIQEPVVEYPGGLPAAPTTPSKRLQERKEAIKNAKPFSEFLTDSFNRQHDYLRISITERCNLRCLYCMPEEGIQLSPPAHLLTTPEIFYLSSLFVSQGVTKIRLTGGEPTVRRDIVPLMQSIGSLRSKGLRELALTTNGISLHRKLDSMVESGLTGINLSLDTLDPFQFQIMTRRKGFDAVMKCIDRVLELKKLGANLKLKINCVVMRGLNERDIVPFVELGREKDIEVRFIEYMPFDGNKWSEGKMISFQEMLNIIRAKYPSLRSVPGHKNDTSKTFEVPGFVGKVGFITSMTNDFCGTCNRLRITSDGNLKVCLHGNAEVSLRDLLREDNNGQPIDQEAFERIKQIEMDRRDGLLSDETILGWGQRERELLNVIGAAVKRKAEKHADIGDLENMKNRPMILIDRPVQSNQCSSSPLRQPGYAPSSPSASLLRQWSAVPQQLPFLYPSFPPASGVFARAYSTTNNLSKRHKFEKSTEPRKYEDAGKPAKNMPDKEKETLRLLSSLKETEHGPQVKKWSSSVAIRQYSTDVKPPSSPYARNASQSSVDENKPAAPSPNALPHLTSSGSAHMVSVSTKPNTVRTAVAAGRVYFSNPEPLSLIRSNALKKGDVLSVARIAGIMAAKKCPDLIPLCHPINLSHVGVALRLFDSSKALQEGLENYGGVEVQAKVQCTGPTGVEMEALTSVMGAALTVVDMCKAVDKGMQIQDVRVVLKEGGRSGSWREEGWEEMKEEEL